jgi:CDP-glycerol glycerophosphotransferase (TagB/SpsB family)
MDYQIIKPVLRYLPEIRIVSKTKELQRELSNLGISSGRLPAFPNKLIMARHSIHYFPEKKIKIIGMRHGVYHFKEFISSKKYNLFDKFLFTSPTEVQEAQEIGITTGVGVGFPKIDPLFNGEIDENVITELKEKIGFNEKPIILFSATWDRSGISAVHKWAHRISELCDKYHILVTLHPWVSQNYCDIISKNQNIHYIRDNNILSYLAIADILISDTSSIIAEFCSLDKPIVTFKVPIKKRLSKKIYQMLEEISERIDSFDDLKSVLPEVLKKPQKLSESRNTWNKILYNKLDGKAGKAAAEEIMKVFSAKTKK